MLAKQAQTGPESGARHLRKRNGMLAKQTQTGPEIRCQALKSGARHLRKRDGMLAKQAQTGPESGARHLWKRDGMLAKQTQTGPESGASRQWPLELNSGAMERSSNFNRKFPSLQASSVLAPGCSDILL
jgi:hypothetical protein